MSSPRRDALAQTLTFRSGVTVQRTETDSQARLEFPPDSKQAPVPLSRFDFYPRARHLVLGYRPTYEFGYGLDRWLLAGKPRLELWSANRNLCQMVDTDGTTTLFGRALVPASVVEEARRRDYHEPDPGREYASIRYQVSPDGTARAYVGQGVKGIPSSNNRKNNILPATMHEDSTGDLVFRVENLETRVRPLLARHWITPP
jgi:hypothetical protein